MMGVFSWLAGSKIGRIAILAVLTAASVALTLRYVFSQGVEAERAKRSQASLDAFKTRIQTDDSITKLSGDARRAELARWVRDSAP